MRQVLGTTVFSGMLGVTFFGLFLTPVFYVVLRGFRARRAARRPHAGPPRSRTADPLMPSQRVSRKRRRSRRLAGQAAIR
jgi:hypothetical protein